MKAVRILPLSDRDLLSASTPQIDRVAHAIAVAVRVAQMEGLPRHLLLDAIDHIWPPEELH